MRICCFSLEARKTRADSVREISRDSSVEGWHSIDSLFIYVEFELCLIFLSSAVSVNWISKITFLQLVMEVVFFFLCPFFLCTKLSFFSDVNDPKWTLHKKHVFVFSEAGKPIYSRWVSLGLVCCSNVEIWSYYYNVCSL